MRDLTPEKLLAEHKLLQEDPEKYIEMITGFIDQDPNDPTEYFRRHHAWVKIGRLDKALEDLDKSLKIEDDMNDLLARGQLLSRLGHFREALDDFNHAETLDPEGWVDCWGPLHRADCHAKLGNEAAALADCARLPDEFWSPGIYGEPRGNKAEITAEVRRRARAAKGSR